MKEAAQTLSLLLTRHNIEHAFIGGFALNMLGSDRETNDIDVEVAVHNIHELRGCVLQILRNADSRFVVENYKLYFGASRIPIETLARGTLNLPRKLSIIRPSDGKEYLYLTVNQRPPANMLPFQARSLFFSPAFLFSPRSSAQVNISEAHDLNLYSNTTPMSEISFIFFAGSELIIRRLTSITMTRRLLTGCMKRLEKYGFNG
jgi:hypothetical protein